MIIVVFRKVILVVHRNLLKAHFNTSLHCALEPRLNPKRARLGEFRGLIDDHYSLHTRRSSIFGPGTKSFTKLESRLEETRSIFEQ